MMIAGPALCLLALLLALAAASWRQLRLIKAQSRDTEATSSRLEAVINSALDAVLVIDRSARILEFNRAAENVFGYTADDTIGADLGDLIIPDHLRAAHAAGMRRYLETGEKRVVDQGRVELQARHRDGRVFPVELSISSAQSREGEIFVAFLRDISDRIAAETELRQARDEALAGERTKAEFLAVMSHEMRTPLNGLLGTLEVLEDTSLDQRQRELLGIAATSGRILLHHVNDVLEISRLDAGTLQPDQKPFDLIDLVNGICGSQRSVAQSRRVELSVSCINMTGTLVSGDDMRLTQILLNILGNALKFTHEGSVTVEIEGMEDSDMVEFRVADTGTGIAEADRARIFDDFVTLDPSYGRTSSGTGLGLGITRRLVKVMNGSIDVESEPGEGSLFRVRLPLPPMSRSQAAETPGSGGRSSVGRQAETDGLPPRPLNILIVEDNTVNRLVAREMLEQDGHIVSEARNGEEGVAMARRQRFDIILMDISMPRMDGVQAARTIRATGGAPDMTPIIALTANALPEDVRKFRQAGMDDVLVKPVSRARLRAVLDLFAGPESGEGDSSGPDDAGAGLFDPSTVSELRNSIESGKIADLLARFIEEGDAVFTRLTLADPSEQADVSFVDALHRLAGSAAVLGASKLHGALAVLERNLRTGTVDRFGQRLDELGQIWDATRKNLGRTYRD